MTAIKNITREPGYYTEHYDNGTSTKFPIAPDLRAVDIPAGLTYQQVSAITTLANLVIVLIRTLIARGVLDESFMEDGDYDLDAIIGSIESMGGSYTEPDISVTVPE